MTEPGVIGAMSVRLAEAPVPHGPWGREDMDVLQPGAERILQPEKIVGPAEAR
jgi:hypothetical protein